MISPSVYKQECGNRLQTDEKYRLNIHATSRVSDENHNT